MSKKEGARRRKITWKMVYDDFCKRFPLLKKSSLWWHPYDSGEIEIYLEGGYLLIYNYDRHSGIIERHSHEDDR